MLLPSKTFGAAFSTRAASDGHHTTASSPRGQSPRSRPRKTSKTTPDRGGYHRARSNPDWTEKHDHDRNAEIRRRSDPQSELAPRGLEGSGSRGPAGPAPGRHPEQGD